MIKLKMINEDICISKDEFLIVQEKDIEFKNPIVFLTYPTSGVIGPIISNQMISSLKLKEIGFFKSKFLSPVVIFTDNVLKHPYLIYSNHDGSIVLISINYPVPQSSYLAVAEGLINWVDRELNAKYIVCLDAIPVQVRPEKKIVITAAEKEIADEMKKYAVELYEDGVVLGLSGAVMSEALLRQIVGIALLTPATVNFPDPEAALHLVEVINDFFKLGIDTQPLIQESENIKKQLSLMSQKQQQIEKEKILPPRSSLRESFV
ncbi:MAG: proteasome assembly chaperone family protein [Candidatus Heimdallarchaeaceae archaeon]